MMKRSVLAALFIIVALCATCVAFPSGVCLGGMCDHTSVPGQNAQGQGNLLGAGTISQAGGDHNSASITNYNFYGVAPSETPAREVAPAQVTPDAVVEVPSNSMFELETPANFVLIRDGIKALRQYNFDESTEQHTAPMVHFGLRSNLENVLTSVDTSSPEALLASLTAADWTSARLVLDQTGKIPVGVAVVSGKDVNAEGSVNYHNVAFIQNGVIVSEIDLWIAHNHAQNTFSTSRTALDPRARHTL